ncbi:MAG: hypothetical protein ACREPR_02180 [Brasilonema sp.]
MGVVKMLNAIEFKAEIKNGIIKIPEEYQRDFEEETEVQIIVIKPEKIATSQAQKAKDIIDDLTEKPIKVNGLLSREEIYDRQS